VVRREEKRKKREKTMVKRETQLHIFLLKIMRKIQKEDVQIKKRETQQNKNRKRLEQVNYEVKDHIKKPILEYMQAFILFICMIKIIHVNSQYVEKKSENGQNKKREIDEKFISIFSPFILLSIIWHMTAIREHGKGMVVPKKKKKNLKKRKMKREKKKKNIKNQDLIIGNKILYQFQYAS
jgi:hypothetical protein